MTTPTDRIRHQHRSPSYRQAECLRHLVRAQETDLRVLATDSGPCLVTHAPREVGALIHAVYWYMTASEDEPPVRAACDEVLAMASTAVRYALLGEPRDLRLQGDAATVTALAIRWMLAEGGATLPRGSERIAADFRACEEAASTVLAQAGPRGSDPGV